MDGVRGWKLFYRTASSLDDPILASGVLLAPTGPWRGRGPRPILGYGSEVYGLGPQHAPSGMIAAGTFPEIGQLELALARGWAVAVADGEGHGVGPGPHPYLAGNSSGHAVLDIVRAAAHTPRAGLSGEAPVGLWGYGEGGRAVAWAAELHRSYSPEISVRVAVAGGVPADLRACVEAVDGGPYSGLGFAALIGLSSAHRDVPLHRILAPAGRAAGRLAENAGMPELLAWFAKPLGYYTIRPDPWNDRLWATVLMHEELGHRQPSMPIHLYHGGGDEIVPVRVAQQLYADYRVRGVEVTWTDIGEATHLQAGRRGAEHAVDQLAAHLTSGDAGGGWRRDAPHLPSFFDAGNPPAAS
ncbi:lipase family protein [Nocardia sp. GAS34]|uniref:lipase family protein n=1 Tax=unclassified Nocardia TaxID=2637762 RepID=UPI003D1E75FB